MSIQRSLFFFIILFLWIQSCDKDREELPVETSDELRSILFLGNSHTDYNGGIDQQMMALIDGDSSITIDEIGREAPGGFTLREHYQSAVTQSRLNSRRWDLVVLQENTYEAFLHPEELADHVESFFFELFSKGTSLAFFMTWPYLDSLHMYPVLRDAYNSSAVTYYGKTIPVGIAWYDAFISQKRYELYDQDGVHPSPAGTFYTACLFYAYLFEKDPLDSKYVSPELGSGLTRQLKSEAWSFYLEHK